jgi:DNA-binding LacI/PurR family transcriptional regulator
MHKPFEVPLTRPVTMRDVARAANVSQSTVSRVLNAGDASTTSVPISAETTQRVLATARALGYQPNMHARSLRGQKTQMIAMMVADISNPYYHVMVRKVQDVARRNGYDMLIANSDHDAETERHFLEGIIRRPVDGVILTPYHLSSENVEAFVNRTGVRVVLIGQHISPPGVDRVYADDRRGTYEAVRWLIRERGHSKIALIGVEGTHPSARRKEGFLQAMREGGLSVPGEYLENGAFTVESGEAACVRLLALPERPSAIFACNDLMALGCVSAAQRAGLRIPEDLAVVGFDNIPEAARSSPPLTTVAQFPAEMGEHLATALFERIDGAELESRSIQVPCKLIVRGST